MNKKILNPTVVAKQSFDKQNELKAKTLVISLGVATQLTLGNGGSQQERGRKLGSLGNRSKDIK